MPTTAVELPYPNADIVKLPSMIIPKKLGFFIHQNIKKVGFFSRSPRVAPYHGEKTVWPLLRTICLLLFTCTSIVS